MRKVMVGYLDYVCYNYFDSLSLFGNKRFRFPMIGLAETLADHFEDCP